MTDNITVDFVEEAPITINFEQAGVTSFLQLSDTFSSFTSRENQILIVNSTGDGVTTTTAGSGDVTGPSSSTDNAIARFDSTTGKILQNSLATISDLGLIEGATNTNWDAAYSHSQLTSGNPHSVTPTELGLVIGTNVQAWDAQLDSIAGLTPGIEGRMITSDGLGNYQISSVSDVRSYLNVEDGSEANNISDINATDLTDGGDSTLHYHASDRNRTNHTGTQTASTISDFDTEVSNNTDVAANTSYRGVGHIPLTQKAANNGVATLDAGGKIPANQLPSTVMDFKGNWDASINTPTLADGTGDAGDVYLTSVAGSQDLGSGSITFAAGDWVVYNGSIWEKSINSNAVVSVNSQTGTVVLDADDIDDTSTTNKFVTATDITNLGNLSGSNTGDQVVPSNEAGASNNFLTAYNSSTGAFTKAQPTEANLSLSDITTNDVSATKHGLFPKLPSVSDDKYYGLKNGAVAEISISGTGDVVGPSSAVDDNIATFDLTTGKLIQDSGINISAVTANTAKVSNVTTNLSEGTATETTVDVNSSDGTNATLVSASTTRAGLLTKAKFDEIVANTAKVSNVTTNITVVEAPTNVEIQSSDGTNDTIAAADTTNAGVMTKAMYDNHILNNAKVTNATHTGDVTGATALTIDKTAITGKGAVTAVGTDYVLISDTSDTGNLKKALVSDFAGAGGITWSTPVDADIVPDTDSAYDLGDSTHAFAIVYADSFDSPATSVFFNVGGVSRFKIDSAGTTYYGNVSAGSGSFTVDGTTGIVTINSGGFDVDFIVKGDTDSLLINTDAATDKVGIGVVPNEKLTVEGVISLDEVSAPSLTAGYGKIYVKSSDSDLYFMDSSGTESSLTASSSGITSVVEDTTPQLGGELDCQAHSIGFTTQSLSSSGGAVTVDWDNGNHATITLTENTTFTFTAPSKTQCMTLKVIQDSTARTVTFPTVTWLGSAPTITTVSGDITMFVFRYDGAYVGAWENETV